MEFNIEIRKRQLKSLKQYIKSSEDNVQAVLQSLGWSPKKTLESEGPKVICPVNPNHLIAYKTSEKHLEKCTLHSSGYYSNEEYLSEPPESSRSSIKLNSAKKTEILNSARSSRSDFKTAWNGRDSDPMTANRLLSTFSSDERVAIYDYSIKHTEAPPKPEEFTLDLPEAKDKHELTEKEKLALERDVKRRRAKYKSVHTSKKSQTEIMREVIDNQMSLYKQWIEHKQELERKERKRLEKIEKEKNKQDQLSNDQESTQYHYIETTYDQNPVNQINQGQMQWNQYTTNYGSQYYSNIQANQGVITDWSHLYQGGIDTDIYTDTSLGHLDGEYAEQLQIDSSNLTNIQGTKLSNLPSYVSNDQTEENHSSKEKNRKCEYSESKERYKNHHPYEKKSRGHRSREGDRKIDKDTRRHRSREKRKDRKH